MRVGTPVPFWACVPGCGERAWGTVGCPVASPRLRPLLARRDQLFRLLLLNLKKHTFLLLELSKRKKILCGADILTLREQN